MKLLIVLLVMSTIITAGCGDKPHTPQSTPRAVAEAIFEAAQTGNYAGLPALIADDADGDSKRIALAASDPATAESFRQYFSKGKVTDEPVISGDKASVRILFGPDGTKEETFEMIRKDSKWYLQSF